MPGYFHDDHLNDDDTTKTLQIVRRFREEYKRIDSLLQKYPEILEAAHRDLKKLCKPDATRDRRSVFTTENLFRVLLVIQIEGNEAKVFSIFEAHTELIQRGKRDKAMEFGHKIFLSETKKKFIVDKSLIQ